MKVMIMLISHVESQRWPFNNTQLTKKCMLSVRTKKTTTTTKTPTTISSTYHPSAMKFAISCGILARFPFSHYCLYCSYIIILDTKLFNVFAIFNLVSWQTSWRIALNDVKRILQVLFQMENIESPPLAAYMKKKMLFCQFNHHFFYLETAHLLEKNTRNVF